jgi:hypothetical protein
MILSQSPTPMDLWRERLGGRRRRNTFRPLVAMGYLAQGPVIEGLIEIEKLLMVVLHDEPARRDQINLRLAGFVAQRVPWGVAWGGVDNCRFLKNLRLQPVPNGPGLRLSTTSTDLLRLGLQLDRDIELHVRYRRRLKRQQLQLPKLWAGFRGADVDKITGDGPELESYCCRTGRSPSQSLQRIRRQYFGLSIYPLAWVSHHWEQAVSVVADLDRYPKRQVFPLHRLPDDLVGFHGAAQFDFYNTRFSTVTNKRQHRRRESALVVS